MACSGVSGVEGSVVESDSADVMMRAHITDGGSSAGPEHKQPTAAKLNLGIAAQK